MRTIAPVTFNRKQILALLGLLTGLIFWRCLAASTVPVPQWAWIACGAAGAICLVAPLHRKLVAVLDAVAAPFPANRARAALAIAIVSSIYLTFTARRQDRDCFPKTLDDQSYVIQMRMLAHGKLWMPQHACADFFDTFHVLVRPKYAPAYFPGTALLYTPLTWLGAAVWIGPVIVAGICVGLMYRVVGELVDGVAGLLAAILLVSCSWFRTYSILVYGQPISLMLGLLLIWAWLRWREAYRWNWSIFIGIIAGFLAITRPADAVCYGLPIALGIVLPLRRKPLRHILITIALLIAGAIPFLSLQAIQNIGITGSITKTPFSLYLDRDQPGANFGFHEYNPAAKPASVVPQKQVYYQQFIVPFIQKHTLAQLPAWLKEHLPQIADVTLPARVMLLFVPIGLLGLTRDSRRWALVLIFPLFLILYFCYPPFVEHYALPFAPAVLFCVAMAPSVLRERLGKSGSVIYPASALVILIVSLSMLRELNPKVNDETFPSPMMRVLHDTIDRSDLAPAVILFRYRPDMPQTGDNSYKIDPVYNTDVAWPDDAPIIRANDLGSRNIELIRYYARIQPQRTFYLFDRGNLADPIHRLGTARELAQSAK